MRKLITVVVAAGLAVFAASSLAGAAGNPSAKRHNAVTILALLGAKTTVPPGKFVKAFVFCPKGYYVTGGGAYGGAITEIVSSPTSDLHGWFVDGTNPDPKRAFTHRADAVCVKGSPAVRVGTAAASAPQIRQAELDYLASRRVASRR
jgi:hypothetical protein